MWIRSLDQEDPLEESMATHTSILAWRISMDRGAWWATVHGGRTELDTTEVTWQQQQQVLLNVHPPFFQTTGLI